MTRNRTRRALEAIGADFTIRRSPAGNYLALSVRGEQIACARSEDAARREAESFFARSRQGLYRKEAQ